MLVINRANFGICYTYYLWLPSNPIPSTLVPRIAGRVTQQVCLVWALSNCCPEASGLAHSLLSLLGDLFPTWAKGWSNCDLELEEVVIMPVLPLFTP